MLNADIEPSVAAALFEEPPEVSDELIRNLYFYRVPAPAQASAEEGGGASCAVGGLAAEPFNLKAALGLGASHTSSHRSGGTTSPKSSHSSKCPKSLDAQ